MELYKSITEFKQLAQDGNVESNCSAIVFGNNSDRVYDNDGNPQGYKAVINNVWELYPGESISFNQPLGGIDTTVYKLAFKLISGTTGTPAKMLQVARINSIANNCIPNK
ncbi:MAG: hypothetical protein Q8L07_04270 [Sediminibacterium sp.]|nr:hypothetical protein [Sediminibacterium sp.]